ncbi:MAG: hypothetical protein AAB508_00485 [Patescibacteria group bacterium]
MNLFLELCAKIPKCSNIPGVSQIDKTLTPMSTGFIAVVIIFFVLNMLYLRKNFADFLKRFFIMSTGVILFQLFTAPMWNIHHLGMFGYIYMDVSWVITLFWSTLLLLITTQIDQKLKNTKEHQRFIIYIPPILILGIVFEILLSTLRIRYFAPEIISTSFGMVGSLPMEILFYLPVFAGIVISFYKFWVLILSPALLVPGHHKITLRNLLTAAFWIFLLEIIISPLVVTKGLPEWTYIYRDINVLRISLWIFTIVLTTGAVDFVASKLDTLTHFILYVITGSFIFYQIEGVAINSGMRWFTSSVVQNFSGFKTPLSHIPIEVALAIPIYVILAISVIRYWRIVWDNKL